MVKEFRTVHLKAIADVVLKISGCDVGHGQNYNHLRHWRGMWFHLMKFKRLCKCPLSGEDKNYHNGR
jgi:hypothetical protein